MYFYRGLLAISHALHPFANNSEIKLIRNSTLASLKPSTLVETFLFTLKAK